MVLPRSTTPHTAASTVSAAPHRAWQTAVAGGGAGAVAVVACAPLDVIKIRFQVQGAAMHSQLYTGIVPTLRRIHREEGVRGLFRGLGPSLWTVPLFWGIWWCTYDTGKRLLGVAAGESGEAWQHGLSAMGAAVVSDVATNPFWVVRTRMIADVYHREEMNMLRHKSTLGLMRHIARHEGVIALYRGLSASLLGVSHVAIQLPLYERLKAELRARRESASGTDTAVQDVVAASTVSKLLASATTYPHEVVRARLQDSRVPVSLLGMTKQIWSAEGVRGFYRGLQVNIVRVLPSTVVTFVAYEWLLGMLRAMT